VSGPRAFAVGGRAGETVEVDVRLANGRLHGTVGGEPVDAGVERAGAREVVLRLGDRTVRAVVAADGRDVLVAVEGRAYRLSPVDADDADVAGGAAAAAAPLSTSPMTGVVTKVAVGPGDAVEPGAVLFVVEAMKMEYVVRAEGAAVVEQVRRKTGERVSQGEVVVAFRDGAAAGAAS
jgi:acetyl/propionyl-CoA carboxylase alpha subunit